MTIRYAALAALAFALAMPAFAQLPGVATPDDADLALPPMPLAPSGPPAGVRKITDGALTCEQIYAESRGLEQSIVTHREAADAAQREANVAQEAMMKQASSGTGVPVASSLLGMIPGAGMFSGMAAQAAMSAQMSALQKSQADMMASYQRVAQAQEQLAYAQARNDHLVGLFLDKNCKVPEAEKQ